MTSPSYDVNKIRVINIDRASARACVLAEHYMRTFPAGASVYFGILHDGMPGLKGVAVFGQSSATKAKAKLFPEDVGPEHIIEMQRLWVSDDLGKNAESKVLSLIMDIFKQAAAHLKVVWTYAGGCKDDCGIVYQSSGFMYVGSEPCTSAKDHREKRTERKSRGTSTARGTSSKPVATIIFIHSTSRCVARWPTNKNLFRSTQRGIG